MCQPGFSGQSFCHVLYIIICVVFLCAYILLTCAHVWKGRQTDMWRDTNWHTHTHIHDLNIRTHTHTHTCPHIQSNVIELSGT